MKFVPALTIFSLTAFPAFAIPLSLEWNSKDESLMTVSVSPFATFTWTNPDGSGVTLTGGLFGSSTVLKDKKEKGGRISASLPDLALLSDNDYGKNGEPAVLLAGPITSGSGAFEMRLEGFQEIADTTLSFSADLVGSPDFNAMALELYGQGDQLADGKSGVITYQTAWRSDDVLPLYDQGGALYATLAVGDFLLTSSGIMSAFDFSLGTNSGGGLAFAASFTSDESYAFVFDATLADPLAAGNARPTGVDGVTGEVTKEVSSIPLPAAMPALAGALLPLLAIGRRRRP